MRARQLCVAVAVTRAATRHFGVGIGIGIGDSTRRGAHVRVSGSGTTCVYKRLNPHMARRKRNMR